MKQKEIARKANLTEAFISMIFSGVRRPSWATAKKLAKVTGTTPALWMEGSPEELRKAISSNNRCKDKKADSQNQSTNFEKN